MISIKSDFIIQNPQLMNLKRLLLLFVIFLSLSAYAKKDKIEYSIFTIPAELKKKANAIVRESHSEFTVHSIRSSSLKKKEVITILNKKGDRFASKPFFYNKFITLESLNIKIYNALGVLVKKVKKSEIKDYAANAGGQLIDDSRVKHYNVVQNKYPYTIEFETTTHFKGLFAYPSWAAYPGYRIGIEKSSMKVILPENQTLRYKRIHFTDTIRQVKINGKHIYQWGIDSLQAVQAESYSSGVLESRPQLLIAPLLFEMDNYLGSLESWNTLGEWSAVLNKGRDQLSIEEEANIKELTKNCKSNIEKVKILYEYMQSKTRYVGIQLGIGGWQSFPAQMVSEKGYGDCKALSNYMKSILKVVSIPSNYTLVKAGSSNKLEHTDFVHSYFNHVILRVPLEQDTIWLECTNQKSPFGFLGTFTDDRKVLCVTENGGELCHTPIYGLEKNTQTRRATFTIQKDGNATANISTNFSGVQYENIRTLYHTTSIEEQKKFLYENHIDLPDFTITDFSINQDKKRIPNSTLKLDLEVKNYASQTGDRLFIPLNEINRISSAPKKLKNRLSDIRFIRARHDIDSIVFELPAGYVIESMPKEKIIESDFGNYRSKAEELDGKVLYTRSSKNPKKVFEASRYEEFRSFMKSLVKADKVGLVLKRK